MRRIRGVAALAAATIMLAVSQSTPAHAAPSEATTTSVTVDDDSGAVRSTITLNFEKPVPISEAAKIKSSIADRHAHGGTLRAAASGSKMWCWGSISDLDANSRFSIQYSCNSPRRLAWDWQFSAALQAIIVNGTVNEQGASWWRNGVYAGQNAPHSGQWANRVYHGNFNPVYAGNDIDYQDYATFRHTLGPGGTGSVSWAGSVVLQN